MSLKDQNYSFMIFRSLASFQRCWLSIKIWNFLESYKRHETELTAQFHLFHSKSLKQTGTNFKTDFFSPFFSPHLKHFYISWPGSVRFNRIKQGIRQNLNSKLEKDLTRLTMFPFFTGTNVCGDWGTAFGDWRLRRTWWPTHLHILKPSYPHLGHGPQASWQTVPMADRDHYTVVQSLFSILCWMCLRNYLKELKIKELGFNRTL